MDQFFSLHSQHDEVNAVLDACERELAAAPPGYNFGFVYATDTMAGAYPELLARCRQHTGIEHWVGTLGIGVISDTAEHYDTPAVSIMLADFDASAVMMLPTMTGLAGIDSIERDRFATHFGLIHGDPYNPETQALILALQEWLDNGFLVGGLTSSRDQQLQVADALCSSCISGVVFSEQVAVATSLSQGCSPIGDRHAITETNENVVLRLDGKPALDVIMHDLDVGDIDSLRRHADGIFTGLCIPGSDRSDYLVRNIVGIEVEHRVFAINDFPVEGNELIFCTRDRQSAETDMRVMLEHLAARIERPPRGGLYVTCVGRGRELFGAHSEEVRMIHEVLGDFPLTGFFANGEIHHDRLYGYTGVLTLFL